MVSPVIFCADAHQRTKITDFGLAKQSHNDTIMQSAVGTISFSCPEIVVTSQPCRIDAAGQLFVDVERLSLEFIHISVCVYGCAMTDAPNIY